MKNISLLMFFVFKAMIVLSQDTIIFKTGEKIYGRVTAVGIEKVIYKKNDDSPHKTLRKSEIAKIKYGNGKREIFSDEIVQTKAINISDTSGNAMYLRGMRDASKFYTGKNCGATGTLVATLGVGILGLIPAIACSSTPPKTKNLILPDENLMRNLSYMSGYKNNAYIIKKRKIWRNFGIACGINLLVGIILTQ